MKPAEVIAARVRALRAERGLPVAKLAARCAELGAPRLNRAVLANMEVVGRRQDVGVTEWLVLAAALNVPPADLLIGATPEPLAVTPQILLCAPDVLDLLCKACRTCKSLPPAGFTCNECGRGVARHAPGRT